MKYTVEQWKAGRTTPVFEDKIAAARGIPVSTRDHAFTPNTKDQASRDCNCGLIRWCFALIAGYAFLVWVLVKTGVIT